MKQGWEIKKLGEVCSITMGQSPSSDTYNDSEGLPFFQGNADFGKIHPSIRVYCNAPIRIADVDDILISVRAPIGAINIADCKCCIGRGLASIRNNAEIANEYIYHALIANKEKLIAQGTGSTFKSIGKETLKELSIPVPPREEQERIVAELDCLSGIIERKREQLRELDALAQSIFCQMFGDPITNEKGWQVKKLGEVCDIINGFAFKSNLFRKGGDAILRISNIQNGYVDLTDAAYFDKSDYEKVNFEKYAVKPYDIVIALSGATTGKLGINTTGKDLYLNQRVAICREKNNDITRLFLLYYLHDQSLKFLEDAAGVAQPNLSTEQMKEYAIGIPPLTLQQEFADRIERIEQQKELIKKSISETENLFNARMDYYFN